MQVPDELVTQSVLSAYMVRSQFLWSHSTPRSLRSYAKRSIHASDCVISDGGKRKKKRKKRDKVFLPLALLVLVLAVVVVPKFL